MNNLQVKYNLLKVFTIMLGAISIPLSTYIGFCFGVENWFRAWLLLGIQTFVYIMDYLAYWKVMEIIPRLNKKEEEQRRYEVCHLISEENERLRKALAEERRRDRRH